MQYAFVALKYDHIMAQMAGHVHLRFSYLWSLQLEKICDYYRWIWSLYAPAPN